MAKDFDAALKDLVQRHPRDWIALAGLSTSGEIELIDTDLSAVTAASDKIIKVNDPTPWLLHLDLQASHKSDLERRLHWYSTLIGYKHPMLVRSVMVLLRPEANSPRITGVYEEAFPGEAPYLTFRYHVVRLWRVPVETFLTGGLGLVPLAPLADEARPIVTQVMERMRERFEQEASPDDGRMLAVMSYLLMGLRYPAAVGALLLQGVAMEESTTYQEILTKGLTRGRCEEARVLLLDLAEQRFGPAPAVTRSTIESTTDLPRLEGAIRRILRAEGWHDVFADPV